MSKAATFKLSPNLKHLLTLRNPDPIPIPHASRFLPALSSTLSEARRQKAERGWLALATATLVAKNSPAALGDLYRFIVRADAIQNPKDAQPSTISPAHAHAALMREAALKSMVFVGAAKVINCLAGITGAFDDNIKESLEKRAIRTAANIDDPVAVRARGAKLFDAVYTPHTEKLLKKLGSYHPDFPGAILEQEYGAILSNPPDWPSIGNVGRTLTSVVGVACLRATEGVGPQLISHTYGLLKAKDYDGFEKGSECEEWLVTEEGTTWVIDTVDRLCDVFDGPAAEEVGTQSKL